MDVALFRILQIVVRKTTDMFSKVWRYHFNSNPFSDGIDLPCLPSLIKKGLFHGSAILVRFLVFTMIMLFQIFISFQGTRLFTFQPQSGLDGRTAWWQKDYNIMQDVQVDTMAKFWSQKWRSQRADLIFKIQIALIKCNSLELLCVIVMSL